MFLLWFRCFQGTGLQKLELTQPQTADANADADAETADTIAQKEAESEKEKEIAKGISPDELTISESSTNTPTTPVSVTPSVSTTSAPPTASVKEQGKTRTSSNKSAAQTAPSKARAVSYIYADADGVCRRVGPLRLGATTPVHAAADANTKSVMLESKMHVHISSL